MDTRDLFKQTKKTPAQQVKEKIPIGIDSSLAYLPLTYAISTNAIPHNFKIRIGSLKESAFGLREGELEIGLVSSIAYALKKETWRIVPGLCLASQGKIRHVQLFFKRGLKDIRTIAIDKNASSEETLLKILMREKFMQSPDYIPMAADLPAMLDKADAALIIGDKALSYYSQHSSSIDLNEEWVDLTGLPFVYAFWAGREFTVSTNEIKQLQISYELGKLNLASIAKKFSIEEEQMWVFYHDYLTQNLTFIFSEEEKEGLLEFYQYAFFYGYTEFIPDLHFYNL